MGRIVLPRVILVRLASKDKLIEFEYYFLEFYRFLNRRINEEITNNKSPITLDRRGNSL